MIAKGTLVFEGRSYGWTESLWINKSSLTNLADIYIFFQSLALRRSPMLGAECFIKAIRVSDEAVVGDALLNYVDIDGNPDNHADDPNSSLNVILRDSLNKRFKHIYFRGIWDDVAKNFGQYQITNPAFTTFFNSWTEYLLLNDFGWMGVDKAAAKVAGITGYTTDTSGLITFTLDTPIFLGIPAYTRKSVAISRLNGKSNLNGTLVVNVLTPTTCVTTVATAALPYRLPGVMRLNQKVFIDAFSANTQRIGRRAPGSPLLDSVGRARVRVRG